ncbi:NEDD8 ultimate buster 1 (Negative regulator of ubiquitin-like proteins 1) (Fragment) [Durusdinium trenchii]|uniref:NEDD8 ultimate buster 1 (Negative regulator of ubiquitin-like proteins 1) n=1 Tax=Durusdinium trenchii TaxID=1381693 RepID=A0ABP0LZX6_9DINO
MGFDEVAARNALEACNGNLDQATQLLLSSAAEAEPTPVVQAPAAHVEALSEKVATLVGMGFTEKQAKDALDGCSGNVELQSSGQASMLLNWLDSEGGREWEEVAFGTNLISEEPHVFGFLCNLRFGAKDESAEQIAALTGAPVPSPSGPKTSESSGKKKKKGPPPAVSTARVGPSLESVKALKDMGFEEAAATTALEACNGNLDEAMQFLLSSQPDAAAEADPGSPKAPASKPRKKQKEKLDEKVATLVGMGFTEQQAKDALDGCSGNLQRAVEYLTGGG